MESSGRSVRVVVGRMGDAIKEPLLFSLPPYLNDIKLGTFVIVEVGGRLRVGCVVGKEEEKAKEPVLATLPIPPLPPFLLSLAHWLSLEYLSSLQDALQSIVPEVLNCIPSIYLYPQVDYKQVRGKVRREIVREAGEGVPYTTLRVFPSPQTRKKIIALIDSQILVPRVEIKFREKESEASFPLPPIPKISPISFKTPFHNAMIVWGGNREKRLGLYISAILEVMKKGGSAILVMPDSLSAEWAGRALSEFVDNIHIYHRRIPLSERYQLWYQLSCSSRPTLLVGNRSAIFSPLPTVKLIIVEGDGESSLVRKDPPSYDVAEVALQRMVQEGLSVIFGSDLPSLSRFVLANRKGIPIKRLRFQLGEIEIVDTRGTKRVIPPKTREEIRRALKGKGKVILVVNRRGLFYPLCRDCGNEFLCPSCNVPLILVERGEDKKRFLFCHLCGAQMPAPDVCPVCGGYRISARGMGIQRIASAVKRIFPEAKTVSLSSESPREPFWEADIIVATKAIALWVELLKPALSCIFDVDSLLRFPSFAQNESVYRLLFTLRKESGKLIIHTTQPENPLFTSEPLEFLRKESEARRERRFPPFGHILTFIITDEKEEKAKEKAEGLYNHLLGRRFPCLPPFPSLYPKRKGVYRYLLVIQNVSITRARQILRAALEYDEDLKWLLDTQEVQ
ncbi:MAG: replication restart helicase PriA [bacterium]